MGEDGKLIVPENAKPYDEQLLELMRQRDALPEGSRERKHIEAAIEQLNDENKRNGYKLLSVNSNRPYSFYIFGGDITEKLNAYMRQTETTYADMHKRYWFENLLEFMKLVRNSGEMDLKNQPEWQHSAYIYDGELVDQDALGNINYGFFGRFCNIPETVLLAGGGFAQVMAGTYDLEYWVTFFDDPRDAYRVMQGIELYRLWY